MSKKIDCVIETAKRRIESKGWTVTESISGHDLVHLVCVKDGRRRAWGLFDRFTCYSEAFKAICGSEISFLPRSPELILESLHNDEVVTLSKEEQNMLCDFMEKKGIDPDDYRQSGGDVWLA